MCIVTRCFIQMCTIYRHRFNLIQGFLCCVCVCVFRKGYWTQGQPKKQFQGCNLQNCVSSSAIVFLGYGTCVQNSRIFFFTRSHMILISFIQCQRHRFIFLVVHRMMHICETSRQFVIKNWYFNFMLFVGLMKECRYLQLLIVSTQ